MLRPPPSSRRLDSTAPPAAWHSEMSLSSVRIRIRSPPARCDRNPVPLSRCICRRSWVTLLGVEIQIPRSGSCRLPSWDVSEPPPAWVANGRERQTLSPVQGWGFLLCLVPFWDRTLAWRLIQQETRGIGHHRCTLPRAIHSRECKMTYFVLCDTPIVYSNYISSSSIISWIKLELFL